MTGARAVRAAAGLAAAAALLAAAPALAGQGRQPRGQQPAAASERHSIRVPRGGTLEIRNLSGPVTVVGSAGQSTVELVVGVRRSGQQSRRGGGAAVRISERGDRVTVESTMAVGAGASFTLEVPRDLDLVVSTLTGDVQVTSVRGEVAIDTAVGSITVRDAGRLESLRTMTGRIDAADIDTDASLEVTTIGGDVTLSRARARRLTMVSVSGTLRAVDVTAGGADVTSMAGNVEYAGTLQRSGRYEFHSHSGNLVLALVGGFELDASTVSGQLAAAGTLGLRTTAKGRTSLRGTAGDGSAAVEATTFSGQITVRRP